MHVDLSIIIVSYNTRELTKNCIKSIVDNTHKISFEIIVVDNASTDGSVEEVKNLKLKGQSSLKIVENKENLGYAKANNQGIKIANGKVILLLNSDTVILENSIDKAYEYLKESDILTINLKNKDGTNQQAAGFGPNLFNIFCWAFFIDDLPFIKHLISPYQISDVDYFNQDHEVDWVMGAFFMMKCDVVLKIGNLDENIFMYGEEMEYCRRAKKKGFKIKYFSNPSIIHYGMASAETNEGAIVGEYRALKYFFQKHGGKVQTVCVSLIIKMSVILRMIIFAFINKRKAKIYATSFKLS